MTESPSELFDRLATELAERPDVTRNARGSLVTSGVRAMTSRGHVVVRLSPERVRALVEERHGRHYKDQQNAWLEVDPGLDPDMVRALIEESLR